MRESERVRWIVECGVRLQAGVWVYGVYCVCCVCMHYGMVGMSMIFRV